MCITVQIPSFHITRVIYYDSHMNNVLNAHFMSLPHFENSCGFICFCFVILCMKIYVEMYYNYARLAAFSRRGSAIFLMSSGRFDSYVLTASCYSFYPQCLYSLLDEFSNFTNISDLEQFIYFFHFNSDPFFLKRNSQYFCLYKPVSTSDFCVPLWP